MAEATPRPDQQRAVVVVVDDDNSDLDPAAFLASVRELSERRDREDTERLRKLEEEVQRSRAERVKRRKEIEAGECGAFVAQSCCGFERVCCGCADVDVYDGAQSEEH